MPNKKEMKHIDQELDNELLAMLKAGGADQVKSNINLLIDGLLEQGIDPGKWDFKQVLKDAGYETYWQDAITHQKALVNLSTDLWETPNDADQIARLRALQQAQVKSYGELGKSYVSDLETALLIEAENGDDRIRQTLGDITDIRTDHMETVRQTALMGFSSALYMEKADQAGLGHFEYAGQRGQNTRPFCLVCLSHGAPYTRAEIDQMTNGNLEPVFINRGGYRCIHRWRAVDLEWDGVADPGEKVDLALSGTATGNGVKVLFPKTQINPSLKGLSQDYKDYFKKVDPQELQDWVNRGRFQINPYSTADLNSDYTKHGSSYEQKRDYIKAANWTMTEADEVLWQDHHGEPQLRFFNKKTNSVAVLDGLNEIRHYRILDDYDGHFEFMKEQEFTIWLQNAIG